MKKNYRTTSFINDSGERQCLIVDYKNNLPLYYPNLFLTTQLRNNKSYSFSSISSAASSLIVFLNFLRKWNIDIVNRLCNKTYLSIHELDILRDFTQKKEPTKTLANKAIIKFKKTINTVETTTHYMRLTIIAKYLCWLANILIPFPSYDVSNQINRLEIQIKSRRPSKKRRNKNSDNSLDNLQLQALFEAIKVGSQYNPFNITTQSRNQLMILMLYHLGLRGGELLNIKIEDINFSKNQIRITRRPDEISDPRIKEPNVKTLERTLPIADSLSKAIHNYIIKDRRMVYNSKKNSFLFITHKPGPTVGHPISKSSYHKIFSVVRNISPQLYALTGHMLRHTWNHQFSEKMDSMNIPLSETKQEQIRSYLMGWKYGSGTAEHYNKRFKEEQANKAALALQESAHFQLPKGFFNDKK